MHAQLRVKLGLLQSTKEREMKKISTALLLLTSMLYAEGTLFIDVHFSDSIHSVKEMWKIDTTFASNASLHKKQNYLLVAFYSDKDELVKQLTLSDPRSLRIAGSHENTALDRLQEGSYIIRVPYDELYSKVEVKEIDTRHSSKELRALQIPNLSAKITVSK